MKSSCRFDLVLEAGTKWTKTFKVVILLFYKYSFNLDWSRKIIYVYQEINFFSLTKIKTKEKV